MARFLDPQDQPPDDYKPEPTDASAAQRLAGALLLVNAALVLLSAALDPESLKIAGLSRGPLSVILDLVVGVSLVAGSRKLVVLGIVRVVLGMVLFVGLMAAKGEVFASVVQAGLSTSLLLLLIGQAGRVRIIVAAVLFSSYAAIALAGLYGLSTGRDVIQQAKYVLGGETEPAPADLTGVRHDYHVRLPSDAWRLRTTAAAHRDNPLSDRWLVRPDLDAHVLIVAEEAPGNLIVADDYADVITENLRKAAATFDRQSRGPLKQYPDKGRIIRAKARMDNLDIEYLVATVGDYGRAYQLVGFASRTTFARAEPDIRAILESFTLPATAAPPPTDVEPGPAHRVTGVETPYTLTSATDHWYVRKADVARADNPIADRWLVRPDLDTHILVIPEDVDPNGHESRQFFENLRAAILGNSPNAVFSEPTPLTPDSKDRQTFHVTVEKETMTMEFDYVLVVAGERAYQILGFARKEVYPTVADEMKAILASFELPPA